MKKTSLFPLKALVMMAMLSAISIIFGKYLAIPGGDILRFSFENLPIIFAGIAFGPLGGALVGTVADLIGCVLVGYAINPIVTAGAFAIGFFSGLCYHLLKSVFGFGNALSVNLSVTVAHIIGSVIIKTFGLAVFYDMPFFILMLWRLLNYVIVGSVEAMLLYFLLKNKRISAEINRFSSRIKSTFVQKDEKGRREQ